MVAFDGSLFLLKVGDGEDPEVFAALDGMRATRLVINQEAINSRRVSAQPWREIASGAGSQQVSLIASGIYTDAEMEKRLRTHALMKNTRNYQLRFANGDTLTGAFAVSRYESSADHDGQELYAVTLESAGELVFDPA